MAVPEAGDEELANGNKFVCTKSTTVFDNLLNQTFTVVGSLKLSQFNDMEMHKRKGQRKQMNSFGSEAPIDISSTARSMQKIEPRQRHRQSSLIRGQQTGPQTGSGPLFKPLQYNQAQYDLFACIVDADVRHAYATLGVNFRHAPSHMSSPYGSLSRASRAIQRPYRETQVIKEQHDSNYRSSVDADIFSASEAAKFNLMRGNQLFCKLPYNRRAYMSYERLSYDSKKRA